ncbi:transposase [Chloroflexi bacterium TSY]|nr:transposase [Chloroflexi bacterium TSY]
MGDTIVPIEMKPGKKWRYDHHYERKGICYILIAYQPHTGQRVVQITERRRGQEYARFMHDLKTKHNPDADSLQIVQDNLGVVHFRRTIRFTFLQREKMFIFSNLSHAQAENDLI